EGLAESETLCDLRVAVALGDVAQDLDLARHRLTVAVAPPPEVQDRAHRTCIGCNAPRLYALRSGPSADYSVRARRGVRVGLRSATGNRVPAERWVAGSNPALSARSLAQRKAYVHDCGHVLVHRRGVVDAVVCDLRRVRRRELEDAALHARQLV